MRRRAFAVLTALLVAGCTSIPTSGPVEEVPLTEAPVGIEVAPQPPHGGDAPTQIIEGFLLAMAHPDANHRIARSYLTPQAAERWDPASGTTVYAGSVVEDDGAFSVRGVRVGDVGADGHFTPDGAALRHDFGLTQVDGQWRVANPPDGVLVSRYLFERVYTQLTMWFTDPADGHLVPDVLTVPEAEVTPARVVTALLDGPSPHLKGVVANAMPHRATLGPDGATLSDDGVVTVDLRGLDTSMPTEGRRRLGAQLLWSLSAIPRVSGLRVTSGGWPFELPGQSADGVLELATQQQYSVLARATSQTLFAVRDGVPGRFDDNGRFVALEGDLPPTAELAMTLDGSQMALIGKDRRTLRIGPPDGALRSVDAGLTSLRDGQWVLGRFHVLGEDAQGRTQLVAVDQQGRVDRYEVELPAGTSLVDVAMNPAGGQAVVLAARGDVTSLGRLTVGPGGQLRHWTELPVVGADGDRVGRFRDVRWNSESTFVVVGDGAEEQVLAVVSADGATSEELGTIGTRVLEIAALPRPGGGLIAVRGADGSVWRSLPSNRWSRGEATATSLHYPG